MPGALYVVTRGTASSLLFVGLYAPHVIDSNLWAWALGCGASAELVLRLKVYVKQMQTVDGGIEELLRGPFDLLRWYENLFLQFMAGALAGDRRRFVEAHLPRGFDFRALAGRGLSNLGAWPDSQVGALIGMDIDKLTVEFGALTTPPVDSDLQFRMKLGYRILDRVGRNGFKAILC